MQSDSSIMQLVSPVILMRSRLYEPGLQAKDVGGAGDCFFRSVSHQLHGNNNHHMQVRIAGVQYMRDHPERFVESNTNNSWIRYLNDMCIQGTWSDALIVQAFADALNVVIHIVESNPGFSPITTVYPVQERNSLSTITIGHIDECHYVSTTPTTTKHLSDRKFRRKKKKRKQETSKRTCEETTCSIRNHARYARPRRSPRTRAESDRNKSVQHREITKDRAI